MRSWPVLDPLTPHARAVAGYADEAGIAAPTSLPMNQLGLLLHAKALLAEAEPLMCRHVLIFVEFTHRTGHPHPHPHLQAASEHYARLLQAMGTTAAEITAAREALAAQAR